MVIMNQVIHKPKLGELRNTILKHIYSNTKYMKG